MRLAIGCLLLGLGAACSSNDDGTSGGAGAGAGGSGGAAGSGGASGSGAAGASGSGGQGGTPGAAARRVVVADWLNRSLSILDLDAIMAGAASRDEALIGTVDLSDYAPGPLEVEVAPGGLAVVSVGPGFFAGIAKSLFDVDVPAGGTLLLVDLDARAVVAELEPAHVPMGIAITADGRRAFTANFGADDAPGSTVTEIDLETRAIVRDLEVGRRPEQIALDPSDTFAIVNTTENGSVRLFELADPEATLTDPLETSGDPSGVLFLRGTDRGVVANSRAEQNYTVLDLADPLGPAIAYQAPPFAAVPYGLAQVPGTESIVLPMTTLAELELRRVDLATEPPTETWTLLHPAPSTLPLGIAIEPGGHVGLTASPGDQTLVVVDLDAGTARSIPWLPELGPTYVAIEPER